jgi:hypothetical protein
MGGMGGMDVSHFGTNSRRVSSASRNCTGEAVLIALYVKHKFLYYYRMAKVVLCLFVALLEDEV